MTDIHTRLREAKERLGHVAKASPEVFSGFSRLAKAATAQGTSFDPAQRELIAAAIAVTKGATTASCTTWMRQSGRAPMKRRSARRWTWRSKWAAVRRSCMRGGRWRPSTN